MTPNLCPSTTRTHDRDGTRELGTVGGGARLEMSTFSGDMTIVVGGAP